MTFAVHAQYDLHVPNTHIIDIIYITNLDFDALTMAAITPPILQWNLEMWTLLGPGQSVQYNYRGAHISGIAQNVHTWGIGQRVQCIGVSTFQFCKIGVMLNNCSYEKLILKVISTSITAVALRNVF